MKKNFNAVIASILALMLLFSFSCAKKQLKKEEAVTPTTIAEEKTPEEPMLEEDLLGSGEFKEIPDSRPELKAIFMNLHFDFDNFSLRPDAKTILDGVAEWMLQNTSAYVLIEGHCDERGTSEYNLALGERRAKSAKKYLVQLGVAPDRISTISYGEEKPLDFGHNEEAWAKNRRDHFLIR